LAASQEGLSSMELATALRHNYYSFCNYAHNETDCLKTYAQEYYIQKIGYGK
jgi:hypothetical protein